MRAFAGVVLLAGCEAVFGLDPPGPTPPDAAWLDADVDPGPDGGRPPFSLPTKVNAFPIDTDQIVTDPSLDQTETWVAFVVRSPAAPESADVYLAETTPDPAVWIDPNPAAFSVPARDEVNPELSGDALTLWFATPTTATDVRAVRRPAPTSMSWIDVGAEEAAGVEHPMHQTRPGSVTPDGLRMVVHRIAASSNYVVEFRRDAVGTPWFEVPGAMDAVNAAGDAANPHLFAGGLALVVAIHTGTGSSDLYLASRGSLDAPFGPPALVAELSHPVLHEGDPWMSEDGRRIYFTRISELTSLDQWGIFVAGR